MPYAIVLWFVSTLICLSVAGCKTVEGTQERQQTPGPQPAVASLPQECAAGGVPYSETIGNCDCGLGKIWDRNNKACAESADKRRCEDKGTVASWRQNQCQCKTVGETWDGQDCRKSPQQGSEKDRCLQGTDRRWVDDRCQCIETDKRWDGDRCQLKDGSNPSQSSDLSRRCEQARGVLITDRQTALSACDCGQNRQLVADACADSRLSNLKEACEKSTGARWIGGKCQCDKDGLIFSPGRGGCVSSERQLPSAIEQKLCLGQLGTWQTHEARCYCPQGFLWLDEKCLPVADLSDREICQSSFNQGRWENRTCICYDEKPWDEQLRCRVRPPTQGQGGNEEACRRFRGNWDPSQQICYCPSGTTWVSYYQECAPDNLGSTSGDDLCRRTGGRPGPRPGECDCGNKKVSYYRDWQFCVEDSGSNVVDAIETLLRAIVK